VPEASFPRDFDPALGFKRLSGANWLLTDPTTEFFGGSPQEWAEAILAPQLGQHVPRSIHRMFETARAAMVYAGFFHPLYALGYEQLLRVSETAARIRCEQLGGPHRKPFLGVVEWLTKQGAINTWQATMWPQIVKTRNATSHPRDQWQIPADDGREMVDGFAKRIDQLFLDEPRSVQI
jgi:hypothetical protein